MRGWRQFADDWRRRARASRAILKRADIRGRSGWTSPTGIIGRHARQRLSSINCRAARLYVIIITPDEARIARERMRLDGLIGPIHYRAPILPEKIIA